MVPFVLETMNKGREMDDLGWGGLSFVKWGNG